MFQQRSQNIEDAVEPFFPAQDYLRVHHLTGCKNLLIYCQTGSTKAVLSVHILLCTDRWCV